MRDYLLRLIEQFGVFWARIVHFNQTKDHKAALAEIDQTYSRLFQRHAQFIDLLDDEGLLNLAYVNERFDPDRAAMLAALHVAEGDSYTGLYDIEAAFRRYERALLLYTAIVRQHKNLPHELRTNAGELLTTLKHYDLEAPMLDDAWRLYAALGRYAEAEDYAWQWLESDGFEAESVGEVQQWFSSLMQLPEAQLIAGGLTHPEVKASIVELQTHQV